MQMHPSLPSVHWQGLVAESQGIVAAMLAAGKAANAQGCAQAADAAAIGQTLEDLMREAEEGHARLLALLQPVRPLLFAM